MLKTIVNRLYLHSHKSSHSRRKLLNQFQNHHYQYKSLQIMMVEDHLQWMLCSRNFLIAYKLCRQLKTSRRKRKDLTVNLNLRATIVTNESFL